MTEKKTSIFSKDERRLANVEREKLEKQIKALIEEKEKSPVKVHIVKDYQTPFFKDIRNYILLFSTAIALLGGFPGYIAWKEARDHRPNLIFTFGRTVYLDHHAPGSDQTTMEVILTGDFINDGKENFYPYQWVLKLAMKGGDTLTGYQKLVPDSSISNDGRKRVIANKNIGADFALVSKIEPGQRIYGKAAFLIPNLTLQQLKDDKLETILECKSVKNDQSAVFARPTDKFYNPEDDDKKYPLIGLEVFSDTSVIKNP